MRVTTGGEIAVSVSDNKPLINKKPNLSKDVEPGLCISGIESQVKFLLGDTLTVIDASFSDIVQRNAVKSLIKSKFHSQLDYLRKLSDSWEVKMKPH